MIEDFFRHECEIYHYTDTAQDIGFGLPDLMNKKRTYNEKPDISCSCYFEYDNAFVAYNEPRISVETAKEVSLPVGTLVHFGDLIIDKRYNVKYTAGYPENIRNKYIYVPLYKETGQEDI